MSLEITKKHNLRLLDFVTHLRMNKLGLKIPKPMKQLLYKITPMQKLEQEAWKVEYTITLKNAEVVQVHASTTLGKGVN